MMVWSLILTIDQYQQHEGMAIDMMVSAADLRPYLNAGSSNKLRIDNFETLAPGLFKIV